MLAQQWVIGTPPGVGIASDDDTQVVDDNRIGSIRRNVPKPLAVGTRPIQHRGQQTVHRTAPPRLRARAPAFCTSRRDGRDAVGKRSRDVTDSPRIGECFVTVAEARSTTRGSTGPATWSFSGPGDAPGCALRARRGRARACLGARRSSSSGVRGEPPP